MGTIEVGELLYEYRVKLTGMTEYGVSFEALMAELLLRHPKVPDSMSHSKELLMDRS